jgi:hypothetical protein
VATQGPAMLGNSDCGRQYEAYYGHVAGQYQHAVFLFGIDADRITIKRKRGKVWRTWPRSSLYEAHVQKVSIGHPMRDGLMMVFRKGSAFEAESFVFPKYWGFWSSSELAHEVCDILMAR